MGMNSLPIVVLLPSSLLHITAANSTMLLQLWLLLMISHAHSLYIVLLLKLFVWLSRIRITTPRKSSGGLSTLYRLGDHLNLINRVFKVFYGDVDRYLVMGRRVVLGIAHLLLLFLNLKSNLGRTINVLFYFLCLCILSSQLLHFYSSFSLEGT